MEHVTEGCTCEGKQCTKCQQLRCIGNYTKDKRLRSELKSQCRICASEKNKVWRQNNRKHNYLRKKAWTQANRDRINEWNKRKYRKDPGVRQQKKRYRQEHLKEHRERMQEYRKLHPERIKVYSKRYRERHAQHLKSESMKSYMARYRAENRDKIVQLYTSYNLRTREKRREYGRRNAARARELRRVRVAANPEKYSLEWKRYYERNRESLIQKRHRWMKANPRRHAATQAARRTRKTQAGGSYTVQEWETLKAQYNYTCLCCGRCEPEITLTADHVIPVVRGGTSYIENIQPLCISCNSSKGTKINNFRPETP